MIILVYNFLNDDTTASLNLKLDSSMLMNKAFNADNEITIGANATTIAYFHGLAQEGYICLGMAGYNTDDYNAIMLTCMYYYGNTDYAQIAMRNISTHSISIRPQLVMLYVKNTNGIAPNNT